MSTQQETDAIIRRSCPSWARLEGMNIHGWTVMKPIGRGGTAEVYILENGSKQAALKLLLPNLHNDADAKKLFLREADFLEDFDTPSIPKMILQTTVMDRIALIMEFVAGDNLMTLLHHKAKLPSLQVLMAATKIIAKLHQANVVHNDIKLANFILSPQGRLHCVDFGSARRLSLSSTFFRRLKGSEPLQGTPSYLAPELIQGKAPSKASDVWALGIMAHYLFAGSPPFAGDNAQDTLRKILSEPIPALKSRVPDIDQTLSNIIGRCLVVNTEMRYSDAEELLELLRRYRDGSKSFQRKRP